MNSRIRSRAIIDATGLDPLNPIHERRQRSIDVLASKPDRKMPLALHFWEQPISERYLHRRRINRGQTNG